MANVLISLVGGRPLPNILLALHYKPDHLYLIVSEDSIGPGRDYEKTLAALPDHLRPAAPMMVKPYRLQDTIAYCKQILGEHEGDRIIINTTLGPKTMAFGAYDAAKAFKLQGFDVEVCYLAREGLVCIFDDSIQTVDVGLREYCASYGWMVQWKDEDAPDALKRLAQLLAAQPIIAHPLLQILRGNDSGKDKRTRTAKQRVSDDEYALLLEIEELGLVSNVRRDDRQTSWTINSADAGNVLLKGDWLEYHVYQTALVLKNPKGERVFSACGWGVEDGGGKGEIDFAGMIQGQIVIASCKTEDRLRREWLEELHSKMEQLGKGMCSGLLISTVSKATRTEKDLEQYRKWARERQIVVVLAEDLPNLAAILCKIAFVDATAEPRGLAIYPRI